MRRAEIKFLHTSTVCDPLDFAPVIIDGAPKTQEPERFSAALAAWGFDDPDGAEPRQDYFEQVEDADRTRLQFCPAHHSCFAACAEPIPR